MEPGYPESAEIERAIKGDNIGDTLDTNNACKVNLAIGIHLQVPSGEVNGGSGLVEDP